MLRKCSFTSYPSLSQTVTIADLHTTNRTKKKNHKNLKTLGFQHMFKFQDSNNYFNDSLQTISKKYHTILASQSSSSVREFLLLKIAK